MSGYTRPMLRLVPEEPDHIPGMLLSSSGDGRSSGQPADIWPTRYRLPQGRRGNLAGPYRRGYNMPTAPFGRTSAGGLSSVFAQIFTHLCTNCYPGGPEGCR